MTISTTDLVLLYGALKTIIPDFAHFFRLIWFDPMQNAPIHKRRFAAATIFGVIVVLDLIPSIETFSIFFISSFSL